MTEAFYKKTEYNHFDNLYVDVDKIYRDVPVAVKSKDAAVSPEFVNRFKKIYRSRIIPFKYRRALYKLARQINLDLSWFEEFSSYWSRVLRGRPLLSVQDFYFLKNFYRVKFQENQVPDTEDPLVHLGAWQRPELVYQLLHLVYKEAIRDENGLLNLLFKYKANARVLYEFGCATAPITTSLFEFHASAQDRRVYLSDVKTVAFHYAAYKFRNFANVIPVLLASENNFLPVLPEPVDAIFCITVFEHLFSPLAVIKVFYQLLAPGGVLFFDYIKAAGDGLDTKQGVEERVSVLDYIAQNFNVLSGTLSKDKSMSLTVVQKR